MNLTLFWLLIISLQLLCLGIAFVASKKQTTRSDYYLAGRTLPFFPLLMTFVATQVGGGLILGSAQDAYHKGWEIVFYPLGAISGFLLLATFLGRRLAELPVSTVAQIFEYSYGSKTLKKVASLLSIMTLFMITVAQVIASQKFLAALQVDHFMWFAVFWIVVFIYTMWGGLAGIAGIDVVQASFFIVVFAASLVFVFSSTTVPLDISALRPSENISANTWVSWFLMPCFFMLIEQDMAQRCFSAKTPAIVRRAALASAVLIFLICIVPITFGLMGKSAGIVVPDGHAVLMTLVQAMTGPTISAFVACAIMMAIISTAVSLIHSISSNLTQDFQNVSASTPRQLFVSRLVTLAVGVAALVVARYFDNIVDVLIQSYELSVACLFVPVLMSLLKKQRGSLPAGLAIAFGACAFFVFRILPAPIPREILELLASAMGFALGSFSRSSKTCS